MLAGLVVLAAGALFVELRPSTFTATSVFAVTPRNGSAASADVVRLLAASYVPYLSSPTVAEQVAAATGQSPSALAAGTVVSVDPGTANVRVATTWPSADDAAAVANRLAESGVNRAAAAPLVTADLVAPALAAAAQANPPRMLILTGAGVAAVIVGIVVWTALARHAWRPSA